MQHVATHASHIGERRMLQIAVAIACLVPIGAGSAGILLGPSFVAAGLPPAPALDSHFRYLSGLLLAIGLGFLSTMPRIEAHRRRFGLLTGIVVIGGLSRAASLFAIGKPPPTMLTALGMELIVTPLLALWQSSYAHRTNTAQRRKQTPRFTAPP